MSKESLINAAKFLAVHADVTDKSLTEIADDLARELSRRLKKREDIEELIGNGNYPSMEINTVNHFRTIASETEIYDPESLVETGIWVFRTYMSRGFSPRYWEVMLPEAQKILCENLAHEQYQRIKPLYTWLYEHIHDFVRVSAQTASFYENISPLQKYEDVTPDVASCPAGIPLAKTYLDYLLQMRRNDATSCIIKSVESGTPLQEIYLSVLQPVMYEVGRLWQSNAIDIAVEHYITAATQLTMAQIFPYALASKRNGKRMVGSCLGSELHELGLHMVCDLFETEGWDTYFLGAITPDQNLLHTLEVYRPEVLCLSLGHTSLL